MIPLRLNRMAATAARIGDPVSRVHRTRAQARPLIRAHFQPLRGRTSYPLFDPNLLDRLHEPLTRFAE